MLLLSTNVLASSFHNVRHIFPLENYSQDVDHWINEKNMALETALMEPEMVARHFQVFKARMFGELSPWDENRVKIAFHHKDPSQQIFQIERDLVDYIIQQQLSCKKGDLTNSHCGFGENHRLYTKKWYAEVKSNMDLNELNYLHYDSDARGILIDNAAIRTLPTNDVLLYGDHIPGEGYPFDNLQNSAAWSGTPVYIFHQSLDKNWLLIMTPSVMGWVESSKVAKASPQFIAGWRTMANKGLMALAKNNVMLTNRFDAPLFRGFIGSVFPIVSEAKSAIKIWVPVSNEQGYAVRTQASLNIYEAIVMPFKPTPKHFAQLIKEQIARPYGWGGLYFYHDCSQELKALMAAFGIWLPRHSADQVEAANFYDLSNKSFHEKINFLTNESTPFLSIVYIGSHVFLSLGPVGEEKHIMTYQNIWGLSPLDRSYREIIGQSVLLPLLKYYPENDKLISLANKSRFEVRLLDREWSSVEEEKIIPIADNSML